nr:MAG: polyprotein 2 [Picornavirales sp.]
MKGSDAKSQNVSFCDQRDDYTYMIDSSTDPTRTGQDTSDAELGNFFSRPIKIKEYVWAVGGIPFSDIFNPWEEYFVNPRVSNRVCNFHLLRCDLHVKIVVNGNGFHYGRMMASYLPLGPLDTVSDLSTVFPQTLVQMSQMPRIFIDPTMSRGGEMVLPFFYHKNNLSIPDDDWEDMGYLILRELTGLKHANGATDNVTISIFAWAENVKLSVLTTREQTTLSPQMGVEGEIDEANKKGIISGPATSVASIATALAAVPAIRPFALATASVAGGIAAGAKLLGYSRPPLTATPSPFRATAVSSLACTTLPDTVDKLTIDDKQELTIDPRISGLGASDPLVIVDIAKRESYLTSFQWDIGTAPESLLWNCRVSPVLWAENPLVNSFHFPACCMAALPFQYWTGSIKFRFQFVTSAYHKGRVKIVYDPNWLASNEYNTNYLEIVDIAEKSDFTISVANGQETTLLDHAMPGFEAVATMYGTGTFLSKSSGNGVIGVYIVNELTTPNSIANNDIEVNVFVSAGDDFEVFVPQDTFSRFVFKDGASERVLQSQSGIEVADSENTDERDAPVQVMSTTLGSMYNNFSNLNVVFAGETIKSFRPLLKRYELHTCFGLIDSNPHSYYMRTPMFPYLRGRVGGGIYAVVSGGAKYNYCNTLLLHWVTLAFQGWRGSIRRKILLKGNRSPNWPCTLYATRTTNPGFEETVLTTTRGITQKDHAQWSVITANATNYDSQPPHGHQGSAFRGGRLNENMEVESPFYSKYRFSPGKVDNWTDISVAGRVNVESLEIKADLFGDNSMQYQIHAAAGEDFQVYFFTGLPPVFFEPTPPT